MSKTQERRYELIATWVCITEIPGGGSVSIVVRNGRNETLYVVEGTLVITDFRRKAKAIVSTNNVPSMDEMPY